MEDVNISKFRAQVVRAGSTPASPGFVVSEGQNPVDPSGSGQNHLPVTIGSPANGLAVTDAQVLTIDKAQIFAGTAAQFVKGDGTLDSTAYGTGSVTSVALTMPAAFSVANSPITSSGTLAVTATGTTAQYIRGDGSLATFPGLTGFVPYTGATADVNLGTHDLAAERGTFENNGSSNTLTINHTSGSGYGIIVTKGGNNEALYVSKTSGSGNAMTVVGGRTSLVDLALSSVTNTAGDFLTLSGGVVHKRTAAQTLTDIGGQAALTNPVTGTGTTNYLPKFTGTSAIGNSQVFDDGTNVGIGNILPGKKLQISSSGEGLLRLERTGASARQWDINIKPNFVIGDNTAGQDRFFIDTLGNVGIGATPNASFKLDVNGTGRFIGNENSLIQQAATVNADVYHEFRNSAGTRRAYLGFGGASSSVFDLWNSENGDMKFGTNNTLRLTIASTGAATFSSSVTAGSGSLFNANSGTLTQDILTVRGGGSSGNFGFRVEANNGEDIFFVNNTSYNIIMSPIVGNVGIGTTSPSGRLEVVPANAGGNEGIFVNQLGSNQATIRFKSAHSSGSDYRIGASILVGSAFEIYSIAAAASRLVVTSGGNVLIGTTTDAGFKLNVEGGSVIARVSDPNTSGTNRNGGFRAQTSTSTGDFLSIANNANAPFNSNDGVYLMNRTSGSNLYFTTNNGGTEAVRMQISNTGVVTIANLGTGSVTATAGALSTVSDSKYKVEDGFIDSAIEKVLNLKPRYFYWNDKSGLPKDIRQLGFYAQEVNEALGEEAANTPQNENTPWGISDRSMIAMLTKAIQEQQEIINDLKQKIS